MNELIHWALNDPMMQTIGFLLGFCAVLAVYKLMFKLVDWL